MKFGPLVAITLPKEPHCPARLARFRLECGENVTAAPETPLPCIESVERPGRCVHCFQAIERAAGAPHGPYCTGDSRCRECARLLREARPAEASPPPPAGELDAAVLEQWRAEADRWQRATAEADGLRAPAAVVLCQRVATLIDALNEARRAAGELEQRLEAIRVELAKLSDLQQRVTHAREAVFGRRPFSSTPVELEHRPGCQCPICTH